MSKRKEIKKEINKESNNKNNKEMSFDEASKYLDNLPSFSARGVKNGEISYNLFAIKELLKRLGNPERGMQIVHIAGTNGKGSTGVYLSNILEAGGYKVGIFSSPELISFDEQIKINGEIIPKSDTARIMSKIKVISLEMANEKLPCPSKFEIIFAIALMYFKEEKCDCVILECGLGGTNDATNVIDTPLLALITDIGIDHTTLLGSTISEIAGHKAGIIKRKGRALAIAGSNEVEEVLKKRAKEVNAELSFIDLCSYCFNVKREKNLKGQSLAVSGIDGRFHTKMLGTYQIRNAGLAIRASKEMRRYGFKLSDEDIKIGVSNAVNPCRFELVSKKPYIIIDGAHNLGGARALIKSLDAIFPAEEIIFIAGILEDKEYKKILKTILPYAEFIYTVRPESERAMGAKELAENALELGIKAKPCESYEEAIDRAIDRANGKPICIFGSLYFAGRIRELILRRHHIDMDKQKMDKQKIERAVKMLLEAVGEDPNRDGLKDTPARVSRMYEEILGEKNSDGSEHLSKTFEVEKSEMVIEKDIHFYSLCEHHMLPFFGNAYIAYLPQDRVFGLSKLARLVQTFARRLQIQENMTEQIAEAIDKNIDNDGVLVITEAEHLCMEMRGIKARGTKTICLASRGKFKTDESLRTQAMKMMGI